MEWFHQVLALLEKKFSGGLMKSMYSGGEISGINIDGNSI